MVFVVVFAVLAFLAGLVVVSMMVVRLFRQVKALGSTVAAASARIAEASAELETISPRER